MFPKGAKWHGAAMIAVSENHSSRTFRIDDGHKLEQLVFRSIQRLQLFGVNVELQNDELVLSGAVNSWYEKQLAQESVRAVVPTLRIRNRISVGFN